MAHLLTLANLKRAALATLAAVYLADVYHVYVYASRYHDPFEDEAGDENEAAEDAREVQAAVAEYADDCGPASLISRERFEEVLEELKRELYPGYGLFEGPHDPALAVFRELITGSAGARAVLLQITHPFIAKGVMLHSNVATNPYERALKTQLYTFGMLYGTEREIMNAARTVRGLHHSVKGTLGEEVGLFKPGSKFDAAQNHALRWVASTMPESAVYAFEMFDRRLSESEKDAIVRMNLRFMKCFGLSSPNIPSTWKTYIRFYRAMLRMNNPVLQVSQAALDIREVLTLPPHWTMAPFVSFMTWFNAAQLPPRLQEAYQGRRYTKLDYLLFALIAAQTRFIHRLGLPEWFRFVTPYHRMMDRADPTRRSELLKWLSNNLGLFADFLVKNLLVPREQALVEKVVEEKRRARGAPTSPQTRMIS